MNAENAAFVEFHNTHHRYAAHGGASPHEIWAGRLRNRLSARYQPPTRLPARGRIEVVRYVRSNRRVELFGKRITLAEDQTHHYVTAIIKVRTKKSHRGQPPRRDHPRDRLPTLTDPPVNPNRNDLPAAIHLPSRNDVQTAPHLDDHRNDVRTVKT